MIIYPAIDLQAGQCVRLKQGDFDQTTVYSKDPQTIAKQFKAAGAQWLHVVDLDGAKNRTLSQVDLIADIAKAFDGNIQVGGGIRTTEDIERLRAVGVKRVIIGSICVTSPEAVATWIDKFGADALVLALDFRMRDGQPYLTTAGWQEESQVQLWDIIEKIPHAKHVLCTDISLDGMQQGPNFECYKTFIGHYPHIHLQASGGIRHIDDIKQLAMLGARGGIIGKALYEGTLNLKEALSC
ncbi:MAG: hisA [Gammaproteobacteria bacterium]|nr:hisA [Gammaproteobacteria bacterium]